MKIIGLLIVMLMIFDCSSSQKKGNKIANPVESEKKIIDEKGKESFITDEDPEFFQKQSTDNLEYFRVYLTSSNYKVLQIRGESEIRRKADLSGDQLISAEIKPFDKIDFKDDGIIFIELDPESYTPTRVRFDNRVPRINDIAKILQNDITRWEFKKSNDKTNLTKFRIYYEVKLSKTGEVTKEQIKEELKKEVR